MCFKWHHWESKKTSHRLGENIYKSRKWQRVCFHNIEKLSKLNDKERNILNFLEKAKYLNRHFTNEDICMANKQMKICLTSSVIKKMQIKTMMRYPYISMWRANKQKHLPPKTNQCTAPKQTILSVSEDGKKELWLSYYAGANAASLENSLVVSYNVTQKFHSWVFTQEKWKLTLI